MPIGGNYGPPVVDFSSLANLADPWIKQQEESRYGEAMAKYLDEKAKGFAPTAPLGALGAPPPAAEAKIPDVPGGVPITPGGNIKQLTMPADPALAPAIIKHATAAGLDPVDLATAMSYETAGTFDPWKAGPTTKWGQHRGLIQWGEPQAAQYGVNQGTPVDQQVAASVRYLQDRGVKPGAPLMDIYSAINAGAVGREGARDAAAGGAPGTVADKVNNQMAGHRQKAMALLGAADVQAPGSVPVQGQFQIPPGGAAPSGPPAPAAAPAPAALNGVGISPQRYQTLRGIITSAPHSPAAALALKEIQDAGKTPDAVQEFVWARRNGLTQANSPVEYAREKEKPDSIIQQYNLAKSQGFTGGIIDFKKSTNPPGTTVNVGPNGEPFGAPEAGLVWKRTPDGKIAVDERGAPIALPYQGGKAFLKAEEEKTSTAAKEGQKQTTRTVISDDVDRSLNLIKTAKWPTTGGMGAFLANIGGTEAHNLQQLLGGLKANVGFSELQKMRDASPTGGALGSVTEGEHKLLQSVYGSLEQSQTKEQLIYNLKRFNAVQEHVINNGLNDPAGLKEKLGELRVSNNEARAAGLLDDKNKPIMPGGGMPKLGEVRKGYRYKGGPPDDKNSWVQAGDQT